MSVKALAERVLQGNRQGNREETKSFLIPENRIPETAPRETRPCGLTLADPQADLRDCGKVQGHQAADTRTADRLTPAERSRWCLDHELTRPGHLCRKKKDLEGCSLWQAVKSRQTLPMIADFIPPGGIFLK
ncbi:MAG: hypothetical protein R2940_16275 [Syntrophotaleaceae bacterium]